MMQEQLIFGFHKIQVETPFSCIGQSTRDEKRGIINDWIYQIDQLLPKMSRHHVELVAFWGIRTGTPGTFPTLTHWHLEPCAVMIS